MKKKTNIGFIKRKSNTGGAIYEKYLEAFLKENYNFELIETDTKKTKKHNNKLIYQLSRSRYRLSYFKELLELSIKKDIIIRDFFSTITLPFDRTQGKNIVLIHHIDPNILSHKLLYRFMLSFFYFSLKKADAIVTVSDYWKRHFEKKGYKNVNIAYNCFDLDDFKISDKKVRLFKKKYNLTQKPIVYIGNCQKSKGVIEAYNALKNVNAYLVTSGKKTINIPAINLDISYKEYLILLKAASVVVTMSKFKEGWCRTAHEAMLLKTPVIGSGLGGMGTLLKKGNQLICPDFKDLKCKVLLLLQNKERYAQRAQSGYEYAKKFTYPYFKRSWEHLIEKIK